MKNLDQNITAIGLMSGTSCDGLDIAYCHFHVQSGKWTYVIEAAETMAYEKNMLTQLKQTTSMSGLELMNFDREFGFFCGQAVQRFLEKYNLASPQIVGSHGHTVFHTPETGLTFQLGSGAAMYAACSIPVACDFRSVDIALGGQGAPLVPMGDRLLFGEYDYCLNLGGISNISFIQDNQTVAFDICPVNMVLNYLAEKTGLAYDEDGKLAASGKVDASLLEKLNRLDFYTQQGPKSLGKEWFDQHFLPIVRAHESLGIPALLATCTEHIATQMAQVITIHEQTNKRLLATGGGAFNKHLMNVFSEKLHGYCTVELVDKETIAFKEALIFALLGVLRYKEENNVLCSSTGSRRDHCGGALYGIN